MQGDCRMEDLTRFKFQSLVETNYMWAHVGYHMSCFDIICSSKEMSMLLTCNHVSHKFMLKNEIFKLFLEFVFGYPKITNF